MSVPNQDASQRPCNSSVTGSSWSPGSVLPGGYRIVKMLGRGGMGTVFLVNRDTYRGETLSFAVKIIRDEAIDSPRRQDAFLRELRNWIDLPEHPNLVQCHFFQTIADRTAIFAEYVTGGSLTDWLASGKMTRLRTIWDIAIQSARGLSAAHACGMLHLDVKPSNILIGPDNQVKVTDFGLSVGLPDRLVINPGTSSPQSSHGLTPAFASPEQLMEKPLNHATDQWSWAVSILYLFTGTVTWNYGMFAARTFRELIAKGSDSPIPQPLASVLDRCLQDSPDNRWGNMDQVADALMDNYVTFYGESYFRETPAYRISPRSEITVQNDPIGRMETETDALIQRAIDRADPEQRDRLISLPGRKGSSRARSLVNIEWLNRVERFYRENVDRHNLKSMTDLILTLTLTSDFLRETDDNAGALRILDKAGEIHSGFRDAMPESVWLNIGVTILNKNAGLKIQINDIAGALADYRTAWEWTVRQDEITSSSDTKYNVGWTRLNIAMALGRLNLLDESVREADATIAFLSQNKDRMDEINRLRLLAGAITNRAASLGYLDRDREAADGFLQAAEIVETLIRMYGKTDLLHRLVQNRMNAANALMFCGELKQAEELVMGVLSLIETQLHPETRITIHQRIDAAECLVRILSERGQDQKALVQTGRLIEILEYDVYYRGKTEHIHKLLYLLDMRIHLQEKTGDDAGRAVTMDLKEKALRCFS
ncbi:serine/threonine protein kinase [bacterium]|nr:serine/threonine protein kinase [candidate division CSSED10-310 bacterium]